MSRDRKLYGQKISGNAYKSFIPASNQMGCFRSSHRNEVFEKESVVQKCFCANILPNTILYIFNLFYVMLPPKRPGYIVEADRKKSGSRPVGFNRFQG